MKACPLGFILCLICLAASGSGCSSPAPLPDGGTGRAATSLPRLTPPGNEPPAARVELGRALFFDPRLSRDGDLSCAQCHQPGKGFSDGRPKARGRDGKELRRNVPTLWNVAFREEMLFLDGRAKGLEVQALEPLFHPDEMAMTESLLLGRLGRDEGYRARFRLAYGDDKVTLERITGALAAYERTLITASSPYDRYAAGDSGALTPLQREGLKLFRSLKTRCFECHRPPTFDAPLFKSIGVVSSDGGRFEVSGEEAQRGFFRVPTLRNIALTAPYMHDGSLATLEEVLDFYAQGGGRPLGARNVDPMIRPFDLTPREKEALLALLEALTDESALKP